MLWRNCTLLVILAEHRVASTRAPRNPRPGHLAPELLSLVMEEATKLSHWGHYALSILSYGYPYQISRAPFSNRFRPFPFF